MENGLPGPGHSSPIIWGNRIFLTAFNQSKNQLWSYLDKETGKILWERNVPAQRIEEYHPTSAPASPTPVTDGKNVYVYFGSSGLTAFDFNGNKVWENRFGPFPNEWGSASSPVLYGEMLLLNVDTDAEDFLLAVNKNTGKQIWKTSRSDVDRSWPTPVIWSAVFATMPSVGISLVGFV